MTPQWIKRTIMPEILNAVNAKDGSTCVFYITGTEDRPREGGNGKTVLLRQIGQELGSPDGIQPCFPFSGILDLYHSDVNTNSGLEEQLSTAFQQTKCEFESFRIKRDRFLLRREAGLFAQELEKERQELTDEFARCLNRVSANRRLVIALDTAERIQYESDEVQQQCGIKDESTTVKAWLLDQLLQWKNCVVLLAGRAEEKPYLRQALEQTLSSKPNTIYVHRTLGAFDETEALAYFDIKRAEFPFLQHLDRAARLRLCNAVEGRPLQLELLLYVLQHQQGTDALQKQLDALKPNQAKREIDEWLLDQIMNGEPDPSLKNILRYLAVARKGLDASLLHHLAGDWDEATCQAKLDAISDRPFVKVRLNGKRVFLHDEMYDLCDGKLIHTADVQALSRRFVSWYTDRIRVLEEEIKREQDEIKRREQSAALDNVQVDSLLYRLRTAPREAYAWYIQQAEMAIRSAETGLDMRLRDELFAFLKSQSQADKEILKGAPTLPQEISCDEAAHWVMRLTMRGQLDEAVRVAEIMLNDPQLASLWSDPRLQLAHAELRVFYAEALIYMLRDPEGIKILQSTITALEGAESPAEVAWQAARSAWGWRRNLVLGRAHNDLGYADRIRSSHYARACKEFEFALLYFREADIKEEMANTLDNMARVYGALYRRDYAMSLVDDGLKLRKRLGRDYRFALSLNSKAIIFLTFRQVDLARRLAHKALRIAERLGVQRGVGLASVTLGRALRMLGGEWSEDADTDECDSYLAEAISALRRAEQVFQPNVINEPLRLIEVYDEMGCAFREQAALARSVGNERLARVSLDDAIRYLAMAYDKAGECNTPILQADACEDLAQTYFQNGDFERAAAWLDRAEANIPSEYRIREREGFERVPEEERTEEFWLMLGKAELLRGHLVLDAAADEEGRVSDRLVLDRAVSHYVLAAAYFEQFAPQALRLETTSRQLHARFKNYKVEDLQYIKEILPRLTRGYGLSYRRLIEFFEDTLLP